jgi:hypothetical protein
LYPLKNTACQPFRVNDPSLLMPAIVTSEYERLFGHINLASKEGSPK